MSESMTTTFDGLPPPGDPSGSTVQPLAALTRPEPAVEAPTMKSYHHSAKFTSMHTKSGHRIIFSHGYFETKLAPVQKYLDEEIAEGNTYLRAATVEEVEAHGMRVNPRATIKEQVRGEIEAELRAKLETEILAKLRGQATLSDDMKVAGTDSATSMLEALSKGIKSGTGTLLQSSITGSDKVSGMAADSASGSSGSSTGSSGSI